MKKVFICIFALFLFACTATVQPSGPLEPASPHFTQTAAPTTFVSEKPTTFGNATYTPIPATLTPAPIPTERTVFAPTLIIPTLQVGRSIRLSSIHMVDAQVGWGIYLESNGVLRPGFRGDPLLWPNEGYILRTSDGGKTWQNVTPPNGAYSPGGFFALDANMAWASSNAPCCMVHNTTQLWRTRDGGKSWEASQPFSTKLEALERGEFYLPIQIQFIDANTGWLLFSSDSGMWSILSGVLMHTTDGGQTWTNVTKTYMNELFNCHNGGLAFINATTGWYGTSCVGSPEVFQFNSMFGEGGWKIRKTTDGGNSFTYSTLIPTPPDLHKLASANPEMDCGERRVVAFTSNVLGVEWECRNYATYERYKYFSLSTDLGNTWNTWIPAGNEHFIDASHGWRLLAPGQLQQMTDDGLTWTTIKTTAWDTAQFDFINEKEGWAIVSTGNVSALVHTTDGGSSWTESKPVIAP
jgi:photosystem II stability/assembly factor-like uncharacterized protein